jgi:nicotinamide-nucleotide amidase
MNNLLPLAETVATLLKDRHETIVVAESSCGGLISSALLAMPGASAYYLGGAVIYTRRARGALLDISEAALQGMRPATEAYALLVARTARERFASTWSLAETGATGPTGNHYGDPAGHACFAVAGPVDVSITFETGNANRLENMRRFAAAALDLLVRTLRDH